MIVLIVTKKLIYIYTNTGVSERRENQGVCVGDGVERENTDDIKNGVLTKYLIHKQSKVRGVQRGGGIAPPPTALYAYEAKYPHNSMQLCTLSFPLQKLIG